jgi:SAM-dependent methyltransferase
VKSPEPVPPLNLANRVGSLSGQPDPLAAFDAYGAVLCEDVLRALPGHAVPGDGVVLDFGCGAGRLLRHLLHAPGVTALHGCDLDRASIDWVREQLPGVEAFVSGELPPLSRADATFDLVIAVSVFSHLGDSWEAWMGELHRVVRPGGLLVATFMGEGMREALLGADATLEGMQVLLPGQSWDEGGPMVVHAPDWIREHWGRWFAPLSVTPSGFGAPEDQGQGIYVGRRVDRAPRRRWRRRGRRTA